MSLPYACRSDHKVPIIYRVTRLRDGKSFATRSVVATQHGKAIFSAGESQLATEPVATSALTLQLAAVISSHIACSHFRLLLPCRAEIQYHIGEESVISHQCKMPVVPPPESLPNMQEHYKRVMSDPRLHPSVAPRIEKYLHAPFPIDVRPCKAVDYFSPVPQEDARTQVWLRCTEDLGPAVTANVATQHAERFLHTAAVTYASDWSLASTMLLPHGLNFGSTRLSMIASLDHVLYFAAGVTFRADEWMLFDLESPVLRGARGLNIGRIFTRDGILIATCIQEALVRVRTPATAALPPT